MRCRVAQFHSSEVRLVDSQRLYFSSGSWWDNILTSLCLIFLICKVELLINSNIVVFFLGNAGGNTGDSLMCSAALIYHLVFCWPRTALQGSGLSGVFRPRILEVGGAHLQGSSSLRIQPMSLRLLPWQAGLFTTSTTFWPASILPGKVLWTRSWAAVMGIRSRMRLSD